MTSEPELLTLGHAAVRLGHGVQHHHLRRLVERGAIPFRRAGRLRLIDPRDLPAIREVCRSVGYYQDWVEVLADA